MPTEHLAFGVLGSVTLPSPWGADPNVIIEQYWRSRLFHFRRREVVLYVHFNAAHAPGFDGSTDRGWEEVFQIKTNQGQPVAEVLAENFPSFVHASVYDGMPKNGWPNMGAAAFYLQQGQPGSAATVLHLHEDSEPFQEIKAAFDTGGYDAAMKAVQAYRTRLVDGLRATVEAFGMKYDMPVAAPKKAKKESPAANPFAPIDTLADLSPAQAVEGVWHRVPEPEWAAACPYGLPGIDPVIQIGVVEPGSVSDGLCVWGVPIRALRHHENDVVEITMRNGQTEVHLTYDGNQRFAGQTSTTTYHGLNVVGARRVLNTPLRCRMMLCGAAPQAYAVFNELRLNDFAEVITTDQARILNASFDETGQGR